MFGGCKNCGSKSNSIEYYDINSGKTYNFCCSSCAWDYQGRKGIALAQRGGYFDKAKNFTDAACDIISGIGKLFGGK